jgi:hypothetical protein
MSEMHVSRTQEQQRVKYKILFLKRNWDLESIDWPVINKYLGEI